MESSVVMRREEEEEAPVVEQGEVVEPVVAHLEAIVEDTVPARFVEPRMHVPPAHQKTMDEYFRIVDAAEARFCRDAVGTPRTSTVDPRPFASLALETLRPHPSSIRGWTLVGCSDDNLATRAYAWRSDTTLIGVVDDADEDYAEDELFRASARLVAKYARAQNATLVTGFGRGGRVAAAAAAELDVKLVVFEVSPHHVVGPDWTVYTGDPTMENCSPRWRGPVDCCHMHVMIDEGNWGRRCFAGSASRLLNAVALGSPVAKLASVARDLNRFFVVMDNVVQAAFVTRALFALKDCKVYASQRRFDRMHKLCTALQDEAPTRHVARWPSFYEALKDLAWDALRDEVALFHPSNAGVHTLLTSSPTDVHVKRLQARSGLAFKE